ncbi:winged helix-turn-helix transcriptional regulator [Deinococcus sp.]|uniref:winged helix-turn-helix transcriptional regulator n=1 Tax=Deinococcus sp. TaxID=47478 RepID=UPI003B595829
MIQEQQGLFCPVYRAIGVLQEKWVLHIVRSLLGGPKGFNELARAIGGCNSATLTQRLEGLEGLGIISKATDQETQGKLARSIYALTPAGQELQQVIGAIGEWADLHLSEEESLKATQCAS